MNEWAEFFQLEPWGSHYDDLRAGQIAAAIYNVNRDTQKRPAPFAPLDFTPWNDHAKAEETGPLLLTDADAQSRQIMKLLGREEG